MSEASPEGSFFCIVPRAPPWYALSRRASSSEAITEALERYSAGLQEPHLAEDLPPTVTPPKAHKFVYPSGGLVWRPCMSPLAGSELIHVTPYVRNDPAKNRICVFFGYLSNLHDLAATTGLSQPRSHLHASASTALSRSVPHTAASVGGHAMSSAFSAHSQQLDPGESGEVVNTGLHTTNTLLRLYDRYGPGHELLLLSELQGQYAFVIFDAGRKQAFAARDVTGAEELYLAVGPDGAAMFTNALTDLPPELEQAGWQELPPGHYYVSGKQPPLAQFALTMEQLQERERHESCETLDDALLFLSEGGSTPRDMGASSAGGLLSRLSSHRSK